MVKKKSKNKKKKMDVSVGKRKRSVARAYVKSGSGKIFINNKKAENVLTRYQILRIKEPLIISGSPNDIDTFVNVRGGGVWGQTDAARTAIGNALVKFYGSKQKDLKTKMLNYDRSLLISDARKTEVHKPSRSSAGPRRTKQQSKR